MTDLNIKFKEHMSSLLDSSACDKCMCDDWRRHELNVNYFIKKIYGLICVVHSNKTNTANFTVLIPKEEKN